MLKLIMILALILSKIMVVVLALLLEFQRRLNYIMYFFQIFRIKL
jgi:hypothetical protein